MKPTRLCALLAALCLFCVARTALAQPTPAPADLSLPTILGLVTSHAWLPLAILATLYVRHMLSDRSRLPVTIPPTWLPTVSAGLGLIYAVLVARQVGAAWGVAATAGLVAGVAGGFFDGLVVGMFGGDPTRVPWYAKLVLALIDDIGAGGGGADGGGKTVANNVTNIVTGRDGDTARTVTRTPPGAARIAGALAVSGILALLVCAPSARRPIGPTFASAQGCQINPAVVDDVNKGLALAACMWGVYSRDESATPPAPWTQVAVDMGGTCGADVADIVSLFGAQSAVGQAAVAGAPQVHAAAMTFHARAAGR